MRDLNNNRAVKTILLSDLQQRANLPQRSAWGKGVSSYANQMLEKLTNEFPNQNEFTRDDLVDFFTNKFSDEDNRWKQSPNKDDRANKLFNAMQHESWVGNYYDNDEDIVNRLATPYEKQAYASGKIRNKANKDEEWLDVQGRALYQALLRLLGE